MNPDKETYPGHVEITSTGFTACPPLSLTLFQEQKIQSSPQLGASSLELLVKPTNWNRALSKEYTIDEFTKWNTGLELTYTGSDKQSENEMQVEVTEKHRGKATDIYLILQINNCPPVLVLLEIHNEAYRESV